MNEAVLNFQLKESQSISALSPHSLLLLLSSFFLCRSCTTALCSLFSKPFQTAAFASSHHISNIEFSCFKSHFTSHFVSSVVM